MNTAISPLLTDLYQLNMIQAYLDHGDDANGRVRILCAHGAGEAGFFLAAGLEQALEFLENLRFSPPRSIGSQSTGRFQEPPRSIISPIPLRPAMSTPCRRVPSSLPTSRSCGNGADSLAQLVETRLINILHFQILVAAKAATCSAGRAGETAGRLRPSPRAWRGGRLMAARASYLAGFAGTADRARRRAIRHSELYGTMAHSFIEAHDDEATAFELFATSRPDNPDLPDRHLRHRCRRA